MSVALVWAALLVPVIWSERRWGNRTTSEHVSDLARVSDQSMILSTALVLVGPLLHQLVLPHRVQLWIQALGVVACVCGILLRIAAMRALGGRYRLSPTEQPELPRLVTIGCYAVVRNPGYTGLVLCFAGLALLATGWAGLLFEVPLLFLLGLRIRLEERCLLAEFGAAHERYRAQVPWRLVPYVC